MSHTYSLYSDIKFEIIHITKILCSNDNLDITIDLVPNCPTSIFVDKIC